MTKLRVLVCCIFLTLQITLLSCVLAFFLNYTYSYLLFSLDVPLASHYYFWVQSYIICLICLPHFLLKRFLMIMALFFFFGLNEWVEEKKKKAFPEWVLTATTHASVYFCESVGEFCFVGNNNDVFCIHIVVSNPKLFWSIGEGSVGRTFRFSSPPLGLKEKKKGTRCENEGGLQFIQWMASNKEVGWWVHGC